VFAQYIYNDIYKRPRRLLLLLKVKSDSGSKPSFSQIFYSGSVSEKNSKSCRSRLRHSGSVVDSGTPDPLSTPALRIRCRLRSIQKKATQYLTRSRPTDRHFYLLSEKIRYQLKGNDRKVFESSSPAKIQVEQYRRRVIIYRILYMYLQRWC